MFCRLLSEHEASLLVAPDNLEGRTGGGATENNERNPNSCRKYCDGSGDKNIKFTNFI